MGRNAIFYVFGLLDIFILVGLLSGPASGPKSGPGSGVVQDGVGGGKDDGEAGEPTFGRTS